MNVNRILNQPDEAGGIPEAQKSIPEQLGAGMALSDQINRAVLEKQRKLYLDGDVDSRVLELQRMILRFNMEDAELPVQERRPIWLYIFSRGGDVDMMWSLIDTLEASETPIYTVNVGVAASAAGLIFLAGHKRIMLRRSHVILHEGSAQLAGDAVKVMDAGESYKRLLRQVRDYILQRTAIPVSALSKQRCHDWELDSAYCLEHHVCDVVANKLSDIL